MKINVLLFLLLMSIRLSELFAQSENLDQQLQSHIENANLPGCAVAVPSL
ncbi:MAG: hypothetical protein AAF206_02940 [Bacteroidota bacterium]